ncbi:uncharacterized protein LOC133445603 [Cololabis saira]|uniref:uncharacterized protein LOC133445603 n=1 Tax=Cololabis saira TaxID=129043 RepID=UPI002AD3F493|nr:uncharacterized protein LOC133445603 [Cololabis saira]
MLNLSQGGGNIFGLGGIGDDGDGKTVPSKLGSRCEEQEGHIEVCILVQSVHSPSTGSSFPGDVSPSETAPSFSSSLPRSSVKSREIWSLRPSSLLRSSAAAAALPGGAGTSSETAPSASSVSLSPSSVQSGEFPSLVVPARSRSPSRRHCRSTAAAAAREQPTNTAVSDTLIPSRLATTTWPLSKSLSSSHSDMTSSGASVDPLPSVTVCSPAAALRVAWLRHTINNQSKGHGVCWSLSQLITG